MSCLLCGAKCPWIMWCKYIVCESIPNTQKKPYMDLRWSNDIDTHTRQDTDTNTSTSIIVINEIQVGSSSVHSVFLIQNMKPRCIIWKRKKIGTQEENKYYQQERLIHCMWKYSKYIEETIHWLRWSTETRYNTYTDTSIPIIIWENDIMYS
jgi:hypothetical protein